MPELTLIQGDERARKFLEEGADIADFLTDPFRPCAVMHGDSLRGFNNGKDKFFSYFWDVCSGMGKQAYIVEYMADARLIIRTSQKEILTPEEPREVLEHPGACLLKYSGTCKDITDAIDAKIFRMVSLSGIELGKKWNELEAQRKINIAKIDDKIRAFYGA